jgi:hypothetical protein
MSRGMDVTLSIPVIVLSWDLHKTMFIFHNFYIYKLVVFITEVQDLKSYFFASYLLFRLLKY